MLFLVGTDISIVRALARAQSNFVHEPRPLTRHSRMLLSGI